MAKASNLSLQMDAADAIDLTFVDEIVGRIGTAAGAIIPILQAIQGHYKYLPEPALWRVCEITDITPATMAGVSTFYSQFRHKPAGRHLISVCHGTACHVKGTRSVHDSIRRYLKIAGDDDTDADGVFTVQKVACLGCCTLAPAMQIDGVTYGHLNQNNVDAALKDFLELERRGVVGRRFDLPQIRIDGLAEIRIGMGSCCIAGGSADVRAALEQAVSELGIPAAVKPVGCVGMCHQTPMVEVAKGDKTSIYAKVNPAHARRIVQKHFRPGGVVRWIKSIFSDALDNLLTDENWEPVTRYAIDTRDAPVCAFLGRQHHIATDLCGQIDPLDMDEYIAHGGFEALKKCMNQISPDTVIDTVIKSGLRGRGGAGFPTGIKWQTTRRTSGEVKYIICNGDEGDPGAFMDRMILESYPYRVLEGMAIAAYAVGANEGYLYIRAEYPLAVKRIRDAIARCEERGFLGDKIFGSNFSLKLRIMEGAGAFVCGEESALIASIEGKRGMPRLRPPYPAESGLWGRPTNVNNVETYSLVPFIINSGPEVFAKLGAGASKGTKVFALAGKIARGGLIEVPMGISVREIVEEIGGGVVGGRKFKAVQIGGPSGGCIPEHLADTPVDYEALVGAGAIMGSGGLVALDDRDCMVDIARYFLEFTQHESCGNCTFCRVGTRRMLDILDRLCKGEGRRGDIERLEKLAVMVKQGSLCGLGQTAPNPVLSTIKHFRDEYEAHLEGRCPAGTCKPLITYSVTCDCIGCTKCAQKCPVNAIAMKPYEVHEIDPEICIRCGTCEQVCPAESIKVE